jgi:hypothetical protein
MPKNVRSERQSSIHPDPGRRAGNITRILRRVLTSTVVFLGPFATGRAQDPQPPRLMSNTPKPAIEV